MLSYSEIRAEAFRQKSLDHAKSLLNERLRVPPEISESCGKRRCKSCGGKLSTMNICNDCWKDAEDETIRISK